MNYDEQILDAYCRTKAEQAFSRTEAEQAFKCADEQIQELHGEKCKPQMHPKGTEKDAYCRTNAEQAFERALEFIVNNLQCPDCEYDDGCKYNIYPGDNKGCKDFLRKIFMEANNAKT